MVHCDDGDSFAAGGGSIVYIQTGASPPKGYAMTDKVMQRMRQGLEYAYCGSGDQSSV